ncbi:MAG: hypothetical protein AUG51_07310 [Acidobacteria bacterium 13_1_20CM_3_53_8]|nr:MAG: hypothetical protein AUG51_07310 [Acidobacteria bacterium 13_1_20CM_3_53_8]
MLLLFPGFPQDAGQAQPSELIGLHRIFVDIGASGNAHNRESIINAIKKAKLNLEIVSSQDEAEIVLFFSTTKPLRREYGTGRPIDNVTPERLHPIEYAEDAVGYVYVGQHRLSMWVAHNEDAGTTAHKFATYFLKQYKKANHIR